MSSSLALHKRSSRSCPDALTIPLRLPIYSCRSRNRCGQITTWSNAHWGSLWRFSVCWHLAPAALPSTVLQTGQRSQCIQGLKFLKSRSENAEKCCLPLWIDCGGTVDAEFWQVVFHSFSMCWSQDFHGCPFNCHFGLFWWSSSCSWGCGMNSSPVGSTIRTWRPRHVLARALCTTMELGRKSSLHNKTCGMNIEFFNC